MSDNTRSIQSYRHEVRGALKNARSEFHYKSNAYRLLNDVLDSLVAGKSDVSQEWQVERLNALREKVKENEANFSVEEINTESVNHLNSRVEKAQEALDLAKQKRDEFQPLTEVPSVFGEVFDILTEAEEVARTRDFAAWQSEKAAARGGAYDEDADTEGW